MPKLSLTFWIFAGMAAGVALGVWAPAFAVQLGPVAAVFLRLIKTILAPLIFGTLVAGIAASGDLRRMGRIGLFDFHRADEMIAIGEETARRAIPGLREQLDSLQVGE